MSKKIICTVTNDLVYDQRMQRICTSLQGNSFSVELVGRTLERSVTLPRSTFKQTRLTCYFNKGFLFYAEYNIRLFIFLLFNSFDIVCGCDLDTLPAAVLAAKIKRKKVVYDAHEYFPESPELIGKPKKQAFWLLLEKILIPRVDAMYTVTASIAKIFVKKYNVDAKLIRNLPMKDKVELNNNKQAILLYQGAVNIGRGINEMLLAMLKIENASFWIAGDGDEMQHVQHSIKELQLENKVKLLGKKLPTDLQKITQQSFIGINLLENRGLSYYYSLGNKTFDYIQAGVPQIMIGFPEYIALNKQYNIGVLVDEMTVEHIVNAIQILLNDKVLYRKLQENCMQARKELCWQNEEMKLLTIYNSL